MRPAIPPTTAPTVPVYPALGSSNFNAQAYTYATAMPGVSGALGSLAANVAQNADIAFENAGDAELAANAAAASEAQTAVLASTAAQAVGAQRWRPIPKYYSGGDVVWSPVNGQTYRCSAPENALVGSFSDPSEVPEDWWLIGAPLSAQILQVAANTNARPGMHYVITAALTLTLPASPALRDIVQITDLSMSMEVMVDPGEKKISGTTGQMKLNVPRVRVQLIYAGEEKGWI